MQFLTGESYEAFGSLFCLSSLPVGNRYHHGKSLGESVSCRAKDGRGGIGDQEKPEPVPALRRSGSGVSSPCPRDFRRVLLRQGGGRAQEGSRSRAGQLRGAEDARLDSPREA